ncbi:MAG: hypothetical protein QOF25_1567, partial [Mycobacterium sp.]|nr:hypothetical protein [Mycobacterium sp.]
MVMTGVQRSRRAWVRRLTTAVLAVAMVPGLVGIAGPIPTAG